MVAGEQLDYTHFLNVAVVASVLYVQRLRSLVVWRSPTNANINNMDNTNSTATDADHHDTDQNNQGNQGIGSTDEQQTASADVGSSNSIHGVHDASMTGLAHSMTARNGPAWWL